MKTYFQSQKLWEIVEEGVTLPEDSSTSSSAEKGKLENKKAKDSEALYYIQTTVADNIFPRISVATSAKEAWSILQKEYQGSAKVRIIKLQTLRRDFENMKMKDSETIDEYLQKLLGSIRGFIGVMKNHRGRRRSRILIWNPITRYGSHFISSASQLGIKLLSWGFGYNCREDDFVVVWVESFDIFEGDRMPRNPAAQVYRNNTSSWHDIDTSDEIDIRTGTVGTFVGDTIYWINRSATRLIRFAIDDSSLSSTTLPNEMGTVLSVDEINGRLAVVGFDAGDLSICISADRGASWNYRLIARNYPVITVPGCCSGFILVQHAFIDRRWMVHYMKEGRRESLERLF
ncbi:UNVERIFIED_CONTAM: hypothetical protein Sradi_1118300 [Sesamum radiatum]|uniref:F-box associated beta-propeller type 1 domain-containing protein n=1 Tax=Sesamum radiatum TaxID=300843 RepID=A0AAW2VC39_SESRA